MTVETLCAQPVREVTDVKHQNTSDDSLSEFAKCAVAMRNVLYQDRSLEQAEFLFMERHFQVLEMAYLRWKRRNGNVED
jgi:hypothetical protein